MRYSQAWSAAAVLLVLAGAMSVSAMTVNNGDMTEGYIDAASDTFPLGWGNSAHKGGCDAYYDQVDYISAPASMKIFAPESCNTSYIQNMYQSITVAEQGQEFTFTGWVKHTDIASVQVATLRCCVGGGYRQLPGYWSTAYRSSGSADWTDFSQTRTIPTVAECEAEFGAINTPAVIIHILANNSGAFPGTIGEVNVDDLAVTVAGTRINLATGERTKLPSVAVSGSTVNFVKAADYTCTVHNAQGQLVGTVSGSGKQADLSSVTTVPGTYVVRVTSSIGDAVQAMRVTR